MDALLPIAVPLVAGSGERKQRQQEQLKAVQGVSSVGVNGTDDGGAHGDPGLVFRRGAPVHSPPNALWSRDPVVKRSYSVSGGANTTSRLRSSVMLLNRC